MKDRSDDPLHHEQMAFVAPVVEHWLENEIHPHTNTYILDRKRQYKGEKGNTKNGDRKRQYKTGDRKRQRWPLYP